MYAHASPKKEPNGIGRQAVRRLGHPDKDVYQNLRTRALDATTAELGLDPDRKMPIHAVIMETRLSRGGRQAKYERCAG